MKSATGLVFNDNQKKYGHSDICRLTFKTGFSCVTSDTTSNTNTSCRKLVTWWSFAVWGTSMTVSAISIVRTFLKIVY